MYHLIIFLLSIFTLVGCGPRYVDFFPYHDDGTPKPKVIFLSCNHQVPSDEQFDIDITSEIRYQMMDRNMLFLLDDDIVQESIHALGPCDFSNKDLSFCKSFRQADFIFILDMLDSSLSCKKVRFEGLFDKHFGRGVVNLKARLKVIDIRFENPQVILYEIVETSQGISLRPDLIEQIYSCREYEMIKNRFVCEIVSKVEQMIFCQ